MPELQKVVQQAIDERVESGAEIGIQVAVYRYGNPIRPLANFDTAVQACQLVG